MLVACVDGLLSCAGTNQECLQGSVRRASKMRLIVSNTSYTMDFCHNKLAFVARYPK